MAAEDAPDWSLLPHQPLKFFGLAPDFDRKELKRAYGRFIKAFRPETHPAEFQRIREAYELLENHNRYGGEQIAFAQQAAAWQNIASNSPKPRDSKDSTADQAKLSEIDKAIANPAETYQRLRKLEKRSPQEYFILATLSDLYHPAKENLYLKWLLKGLTQMPNEPGLKALVREYLLKFVGNDSAISILLTLSKIVSGDDFYPMTETLWDRLLQQSSFSVFEKALQACEANLRLRSLRPKLAFYLHIIRRAAWKAPQTWLQTQMEFLERHGSEIDDALDEDMDFLQLLVKYILDDREFIRGETARKLDTFFEVYCTHPWSEVVKEGCELFENLARHGNALMDAFPWNMKEGQHRMLLIALYVSSDISAQTGIYFEDSVPPNVPHLSATFRDFSQSMINVSKKIDRLSWYYYTPRLAALMLVPLVICFGLGEVMTTIGILWIPVSLAIFFGVLKHFVFKKHFDLRKQTLIAEYAETQWRPRMFRYVQACHTSLNDALRQLHNIASGQDGERIVEVIYSYTADDLALMLFTRLQPFMR